MASRLCDDLFGKMFQLTTTQKEMYTHAFNSVYRFVLDTHFNYNPLSKCV